MIKIPIEIPKFECGKCAKCCKVLTYQKPKETPFFADNMTIGLYNVTLPIWDWEVKIFEKKGYKDLVVPSSIVFDLKGNKSIILEYTLTQNNCPLLEDNLCSVHFDKPITCNAFPCSYFINFNDDMNVGKLDFFNFSKQCGAELPKSEIMKYLGQIDDNTIKISPSKLYNTLYARYGDAFLYNQINEAMKKSIAQFFIELENVNKIQIAREGYPIKYLKRRIENSEKINLSEYYKKLTNGDLEKFARDIGQIRRIFEETTSQ